MRCYFSQICFATLNAAATHTCRPGRVACAECGTLCDGGELRFLKDSEFIKHLERLGIDESNSLVFLCYMDFSNTNSDCANYMCRQTMCQNMQGVPDICMLIVSENKAVFASIECKCGMVQRSRKTELVADTLIDDVRAKVSRLCQQPSFVILLLNRKLYGRVIAMKEEFVNNNIYPFPCLEHVSR
jgi:hypothetical protein